MALQSDTRRPTAGLAFRALAGILALTLGSTLIACSSAATSSSSSTTVAPTPTTAVDTGTGPISITASLRATEVASGFNDATNIVSRPMRNQLWVTQRSGSVRAIEIQTAWNFELGRTQRKGFKTYPGAVVDISSEVSTGGERGLLGIAFSTDARTLFLSYVNKNGEIVIASWAVTDPTPAAPITDAPPTSSMVAPSILSTLPILPTPVVNPASKRTLLTIAHEGSTNYAGHLMLGRDGFLYIGVGDSPNGVAEQTAQNPESLLGKILRIDPAGATTTDPYAIPPGNPFASSGGAPQIWTLGAQNPLRFSFDRSNGNMWVADAGRVQFGEIDYLPVSAGAGDGANLGWPFMDGKETGPSADKAPSSIVTPIGVTPNTSADCPLIGGFVYRGSVTEIQGVYIYGDFCTGSVKGLLQRKGILLDDKAIGPQLGTNSIMAFAEDNQGELYTVTAGGSVQKLVAA